jgi:hypothetical protein
MPKPAKILIVDANENAVLKWLEPFTKGAGTQLRQAMD